MKLKFDPRGLLYLGGLLGGLLFLSYGYKWVKESNQFREILLPILVGFLVLVILWRAFSVPLAAAFGLYRYGEGIVRRALTRAPEEGPLTAALRLQLFYFCMQQGRLGEAEEALAGVHRADLPEGMGPVLDLNASSLHLAHGRYQAALDSLRLMSIEEFPEKGRPLFLNNLAYAYGELGINLDDAVEIADRAFGMRHDPRIAGTLAGLMNRIHRPDAALQWAGYALRHVPRRERNSRAYGHYCRAVALGMLGRLAEGRRDALKARELVRLPELGSRIEQWFAEHGDR